MRALLIFLALAGPASAAPDPDEGAAYWHLEPREPFFVREGELMVPRRPRSRARPFPAVKAPGTTRVFVLGGSVAYQYDQAPEKAGGWTLERVLERAFPGRRFEVIHCGMGGYDSFRESLVLREVLGYGADAVVLMSGNNEDRADAGPPSWKTAAVLRLRRALRSLGVPVAAPRPAAGLSDLRTGFLSSFESNLREMVRRARARGAIVTLCALPRQLGLPPRGALPLRTALFARGWDLLESGRARAAEEALRRYAAGYPDEPFGRLWLGRLLERRGAAAAARAEYRRALELSCHVPKANAAVRAVARSEGAALADLERALGPADGEARNARLLSDEMHWNRFADPRVSLEVAAALASAPAELPGAAWRAAADRKWLSEDPEGLRRLKPASAERDEIQQRRLETAFWLALDAGPAFAENSVALFESLIAEAPARTALLAEGDEALRRRVTEALAQGVWFEDRPESRGRAWAWGLGHLGEAYRRSGARARARQCFRLSLSLDPAQERVAAALDGRRPLLAAAEASPFRLDEEGVARAFAAFARRDWARGFKEIGEAADGVSRAGARALRDHCASPGRDCSAWARAQDELKALNDEGIAAFLKGDHARAAGAFDRALAWQPTHTSSLMNRAAVAAAQGRLELAAVLYGRALEGDSAAPGLAGEILASRAEVLERLGRAPEAAADLRAALRGAASDWPRAPETRERLRRLRR